jgi:hypothetical protein
VVTLRGGVYRLTETLVFSLEDAGSTAGPISYIAYPGETPIISSGIVISGWRQSSSPPFGIPQAAQGKIWEADIPSGLGRFKSLYENGIRLPRAQHTQGFIPTSKGNRTTLHFPTGSMQAWSNIQDIDILTRPSNSWVANVLPLASVNVSAGTATTSVPATYNMGPLPSWANGQENTWVQNIPEALDKAGEWISNTSLGKIFYWPLNIDMNSKTGNPQFVNMNIGDYKFKSGSPALELGIEGLDTSVMGRLPVFTLQSVNGGRKVRP